MSPSGPVPNPPGGPPEAANPERRRSRRIRGELRVHIRNGVLTAEARSADVSMGGILLVRDQPSFGATDRIYLTLELELPGNYRPIHTVARPIWSQGPFQALKFVQMSDTDRLSLAEHLDRSQR